MVNKWIEFVKVFSHVDDELLCEWLVTVPSNEKLEELTTFIKENDDVDEIEEFMLANGFEILEYGTTEIEV